MTFIYRKKKRMMKRKKSGEKRIGEIRGGERLKFVKYSDILKI